MATSAPSSTSNHDITRSQSLNASQFGREYLRDLVNKEGVSFAATNSPPDVELLWQRRVHFSSAGITMLFAAVDDQNPGLLHAFQKLKAGEATLRFTVTNPKSGQLLSPDSERFACLFDENLYPGLPMLVVAYCGRDDPVGYPPVDVELRICI
eukprot:gnl/Spiro4/5858_TR2991_c0_g1_i1.p1 gnl/Spiro4/5858_TR2991_c0_g1~~gnl/Spiro4/5858_TR2991_c0_g1_i1.p1  ORF type:complete len:165 (-),score=40.32 gnl/Spiro4/5858_TR2991_c0_g1_i1:177-635(-)